MLAVIWAIVLLMIVCAYTFVNPTFGYEEVEYDEEEYDVVNVVYIIR